MAKCTKCTKDIINKSFIVCNGCKKHYHTNCTKISEQIFYLLRAKKSHSWTCVKCLKAQNDFRLSLQKINSTTSASSTPSAKNVRNIHTPSNYVTKRTNYNVNISIENSFDSLDSLTSDDNKGGECSETLGRSCPTFSHNVQDELEELKLKNNELERKLINAENEIENLILENGTLKKEISAYERRTKTLTRICKSTPVNNNKRTGPKSTTNKTRLNLTDTEGEIENENNNNLKVNNSQPIYRPIQNSVTIPQQQQQSTTLTSIPAPHC